ncbi:FAD binding domain-containing protein [Rhizobium sp. EC-SD404]|uniref:FAD binding domain-containing protein n=1 Tax=Rhizobium sp. EC-SD404 TaxID=2038389 RepID=UPI0012584320|nr:FAD binding domain-containing protein [Rhizobium sp. EC-SD404]VVS97470.1 Carbon monoxide dehydrogenase [Rhizobium sp. EC-SD404]
MKPAAFDYLQAATLDEALDALQEAGGDARVIAGGQSLVPMLNMRLARPAVLVDIMRIEVLQKIERSGGDILIGAGVRQAKLEAWPDLADRLPLVAMALPWLGHVQTRARGTVCGSLAHADPSAELPLSLIALQGSVHLRTKRKKRTVSAEDFFLGMMATELAEGEMIEAVSFPARAVGTGYGFNEIGRRHGDFAITAVAAVVTERAASIAVAGVDDRPRRFDVPLPSDSGLDDALNEIAWDLNARDDIHASARYRRELVRRLGRRTIEEAAACLA